MSDATEPNPPTERTVTVVWPSIAAGDWGRWLGRLYGIRAGVRLGPVPITLGWLLVVLSGPIAALLYLARKAPRKPLVLFGPINPDCLRYRLTTARVLVEHPLEKDHPPVAAIDLSEVDGAEIDVRPGQAWFHVGDVVLLADGEERLRLAGVPRPEPFVRTLLKTQQAALIGGPAPAPPAAAAAG